MSRPISRSGKDGAAKRVENGSAPESWRARAGEAAAWEREHEAEWVKVDRHLRGLAGRRAALDAEELALLRHAEQLKLWLGFGYGSLLEYMEKAMGYSPHTAVERLRVARALAELPMIAGALQRGELLYSVVRELSRVAISETEDVWLEAARGRCAKEVEAMVSGRKAGDLPTDPTEPRLHRRTITIELSPEGYDLLRRMHALAAEEHGQRLTDDELLQSLYRRAYSAGGAGSAGGASEGSVAGGDKVGSPAYKIAIKQCSDCKRAWQFTGGRDIEIDPAVAECAACDAVHLGSLDAEAPQRATTTVTPRKREQVLARDGYCCTVPGCRRNIGLDIHHIEYQSRGGSHEMSNIISICDLHHRAVHCGKLVIRGTAPDYVTFEFRKPRGYWNQVDDDLAGEAATAASLMARPEAGAARLEPEPVAGPGAAVLEPVLRPGVEPQDCEVAGGLAEVARPSTDESLSAFEQSPTWDSRARREGVTASHALVHPEPAVRRADTVVRRADSVVRRVGLRGPGSDDEMHESGRRRASADSMAGSRKLRDAKATRRGGRATRRVEQ